MQLRSLLWNKRLVLPPSAQRSVGLIVLPWHSLVRADFRRNTRTISKMAAPKQPKSFIELLDIIDNVPYDFNFNGLFKLLLPNDTRPHGLVDPSIVVKMPWSEEFKIDQIARTVQLTE